MILLLDNQKIKKKSNRNDYEIIINLEGMKQVLSNLIDNAIRYYDGNTAIKITGEQMDSLYKVSITGPGKSISPQEAAMIFQRFYRLDASRNDQTGGSGLGLSIAKEIVEKHGGDIGLISEDNENTFWFTLPSSS